jgi:catechol 2,3-dioxygenase-like lactoylglutathione lyase family enzyme
MMLQTAIPILFVRDVVRSAAFYCDKLGFAADFLHGEPPFYGSVSRDSARLHLRFVHDPVFDPAARDREESLVMVFIRVDDIHALAAEFEQRGVEFAQKPTKQPWGGTDFHIRDPDGNTVAFAAAR